MRRMAVVISGGARVQATRHPVQEYVLLAPPMVTVRSSISGRVAMLTCSRSP